MKKSRGEKKVNKRKRSQNDSLCWCSSSDLFAWANICGKTHVDWPGKKTLLRILTGNGWMNERNSSNVETLNFH